MGQSQYLLHSRSARATTDGYFTKSVNDIFEQNKKRQIHESMDPKNAKIREARDSVAHPNSFPIIVDLDVTGSMGRIPHHLVKDGLPNMVSEIAEGGVPDPAILFMATGDSKHDRYPFQVGQFESGDVELDMWLTRTYLEGGGGGNQGESYAWAWYFAANHCVTDAWEKRHIKGVLFTIGDEHCHATMTNSELSEVMGVKGEVSLKAEDLLRAAQEKWNVYHLHILEGGGASTLSSWQKLLGKNCIPVENHETLDKVMAEIVKQNHSGKQSIVSMEKDDESVHITEEEELNLL